MNGDVLDLAAKSAAIKTTKYKERLPGKKWQTEDKTP